MPSARSSGSSCGRDSVSRTKSDNVEWYAFHEWLGGMQVTVSDNGIKFGKYQVVFDSTGITFFKDNKQIWHK